MTLKPDFVPSPRWMDAVDMAVVAFIVYRVVLLIRGTRARCRWCSGLRAWGGIYRVTAAGPVHSELAAQQFLRLSDYHPGGNLSGRHPPRADPVTGPFSGFSGANALAAEELAQAAGWLSAHRSAAWWYWNVRWG